MHFLAFASQHTFRTMSKWLLFLPLAVLVACKSDVPAPVATPASDAPVVSTGPITQASAAADEATLPVVTTAIDAVTGYMDPVCQMKIAKDVPERHTHESVTWGFCSASCRERFAAEPASYLAALEE